MSAKGWNLITPSWSGDLVSVREALWARFCFNSCRRFAPTYGLFFLLIPMSRHFTTHRWFLFYWFLLGSDDLDICTLKALQEGVCGAGLYRMTMSCSGNFCVFLLGLFLPFLFFVPTMLGWCIVATCWGCMPSVLTVAVLASVRSELGGWFMLLFVVYRVWLWILGDGRWGALAELGRHRGQRPGCSTSTRARLIRLVPVWCGSFLGPGVLIAQSSADLFLLIDIARGTLGGVSAIYLSRDEMRGTTARVRDARDTLTAVHSTREVTPSAVGWLIY